jgi:hypothetical protein
MTRTLASLTLAVLFGASVIGCDDKVAEKKTVETTPDGTTVTKKETVKQDDDSTTVKKSVDVDRPGLDGANDEASKKTTIKTE